MSTTQFSAVATRLIASVGSTAHSAIIAYREGGERLAQATGQRWNLAAKEAAPKLSPETRRNAAHAKKVLGGYYTRGLQLSASGAQVAVNTLVDVTTAAVERVSAFAQSQQRKSA